MGKVATEDTLREAVDVLKIISKNNLGTFQNYKDIRNVVRAGMAREYFSVGDQVVTPYAIEKGSTYNAPWDVKHIADDGVYLGMHYALPDDMQFDAPEAIYYASQELPAGTYNITIGVNYSNGWVAGKSIQFTLANPVPVGGQIYIECSTNNANDPTAGRTLTVYQSKGSTTVVETTTTSLGTEGTNLGSTSTNAQKTNGNINAISRAVYGSGRYSESAIRQWLNSELTANMWWKPQNNWDRPPRTADLNRAGFLSRLPAEFVNILDYNDITVALNTQEGFSTDREVVRDRIFLPSLENMNINPQLSGAEGPVWDYYKILAEQAGLTGMFQQGKTYEILKHYNLSSVGSNLSSFVVWLLSCNRGNASNAWLINYNGSVYTTYAYNAIRSCPACKIRTIE